MNTDNLAPATENSYDTSLDQFKSLQPIPYSKDISDSFPYEEEKEDFLKEEASRKYSDISNYEPGRKAKLITKVEEKLKLIIHVKTVPDQLIESFWERDEIDNVINVTLLPYRRFKPSARLVNLVKEHMIQPTEKSLIMLKRFLKAGLETKDEIDYKDEDDYISSLIVDNIEGLMTTIARREFIAKVSIEITRNERFAPEICDELIERLGLDSYNPRPVLETLYMEFYNFVDKCRRERPWGIICIDNSHIKLFLKENAFSIPVFNKS